MFQPITGSSVVGTFSTTNLDLGNGVSFIPTYNAANMTLTAVPTGVTTYWVGPNTGGDWGNAANWSNNAVPTTSDVAYIGSAATVTFSESDSSVVASLYVDGTLNISGGNLTVGSTAGSDNFDLSSGTVDGAGVINVNGTASWSGGTMQGSGTTNFNGATTIGGDGTQLITLAGGRVLGGSGAPR